MNIRKIRYPLYLKAMAIVILMSVFLCAAAVCMIRYRFSRSNTEYFEAQANNLAYTTSLLINGDDLRVVVDNVLEIYDSIPNDELVLSDEWGSDAFNAYTERFSSIYDLPEYKSVYNDLRKIQTGGIYSLSSVYTVIFENSRGHSHAMYIVDAAEEDPCPPGVIEHIEGADMSAADDPSHGVSAYVTNTGMYGWLVTAGYPIYDSNNEYVGLAFIDLSMTDIKSNENGFTLFITITLVLLTAIICVAILLFLNIFIIHPINTLSTVADEYVGNNKNRDGFAALEINQSDEIGRLADAMKRMEKDLNNQIDSLTNMTTERERVNTELRIAAKMQSDMLPKQFPRRDDLELYATMTPAREMCGDFYDFFMIDDDHLGLVMADVAGQGIPATMFMIVAKTLLKIRTTAVGTPSDMLWDVNNTLCTEGSSGLCVTVWFGIMTISTGSIVYANAGHEFPIIIHSDGSGCELIREDSMPPLASMENVTYNTRTLQLDHGDRLFLYTDGIPEAKAPDGARFTMKKLLETLEQDKDMSPVNLLRDVNRKVYAFSGEGDMFDDVTMMCILWKGKH